MSASCDQESLGAKCPHSYLCEGMIYKCIDCFRALIGLMTEAKPKRLSLYKVYSCCLFRLVPLLTL